MNLETIRKIYKRIPKDKFVFISSLKGDDLILYQVKEAVSFLEKNDFVEVKKIGASNRFTLVKRKNDKEVVFDEH